MERAEAESLDRKVTRPHNASALKQVEPRKINVAIKKIKKSDMYSRSHLEYYLPAAARTMPNTFHVAFSPSHDHTNCSCHDWLCRLPRGSDRSAREFLLR